MSKLSMYGKLKRVTPVETVETKKGQMTKRYMIIDTEVERYNLQAFELWNDHCSLCQGIGPDTPVTVYYDIRTQIYDTPGRAVKAFVSLNAWRVLEHTKPEIPMRMKDTWAAEVSETRKVEDDPMNWLP